MPLIKRLVVIGVGLIGGSLARVLREQCAVDEIIGIGRGEANLQKAMELGVIDCYTTDASKGVTDADMVFISTPVCSIAGILAKIAPTLSPGCVVTDGGSVKGEIVATCESVMPPGTFFVGSHPIAGTEQSGVEASFATLYKGKRCIITPSVTTDKEALAKVVSMWKLAGSEVVLMDVVKHDRVVAAISHLPHMVAYSLVNAMGGYNRFEENILKYSAGGFLDFTRIASSDPAMWRDIALMNRQSILELMDIFSSSFTDLRAIVESGDSEALETFFARSKEQRDAIL